MKRVLGLLVAAALLASGCAASKPATSGTTTAPVSTAPTVPATPPSAQPPDAGSVPAAEDEIVWRQGGIGYPLKSDDPRAEGKKVVMLTFDDGPASAEQKGATAEILDILKKENIKATFFVTGYGVKANPDLLQREVAEGHTIGTHTMTHPELWEIPTRDGIEKEMLGVGPLVEQVTGKPVKYFRPPNGMYSDPNGFIKQVARENNLEIINWTTGSLDWQYRDPQKITEQVLKTIVPGGIVLMHDTHTWTAQALPGIIQGLRDKGYEFVTIR
ncbi:MAG: polysaccharide deacetylase family protein [Bacillota bacterium]